MAARKYKVKTCPKCGGFVEAEGGYDGQEDVCKSYCGWDQRDDYSVRPLPVTAHDSRDIDPLVEAGRLALRVLDRIGGEAYATEELEAALAPFDSEEKT
jgi:hypothetical protein